MAAQPGGTNPQELLPPDMALDSLLQISPRTAFYSNYSFQQPTIRSIDRITPQTSRLLGEGPSNKPDFDGEQTQMSQTSAAASAQAQDFFIHSTSVLKATFLKTSTPSDAEISRLAAKTGLDEYRVSTWFDIIRSLSGDRGSNTLPTPELTQAYMPPNSNVGNMSNFPPAFPIDLGLSGTVENFPTRSSQTKTVRRRKRSSPSNSQPSRRQRKEKASQNKNPSLALEYHRGLSPRHSGKVSEQGQYCCPTCKFKTKKMDQWYTHQSRKHFPSEVFVCRTDSGEKRCHKGPDDPCKRKDNFETHLKESHGYESGEALDKEVSKSTIKVTGLFHDKCGFCSLALNTREDSLEHIGRHIEEGDDIDDWRHQCTSLDHKLEYPVHFDTLPDEPEIDDDNSDDDDMDPGNFRGWTQGGDYDPGDEGNLPGWNPDQGPGEGNTDGGAGGAHSPMRFMTAAQSVVSPQMEALKRGTSPEGFEQDSSHVRPLQSFAVRRTLGHGGSGAVFEVSQVGSKQTFALKTIRRERLDSSGADRDAFRNEVQIMKSLRHPHIVQLLDSYVHPERFSLLFAPVADMDLARYLKISEEPSLKDTRPLELSKVFLHGMGSITAALKSIHSLPVPGCHGDIKPANILIYHEKFLVADFGASKIMPRNGTSTTKNVRVTPEYAAPETIESRSLSPASDIWSLACVFSEMATVLLDRKLSDFADFRATALGDKSYHKTLGRTYEWIDMLDEEQKRRNCSELAQSIPFDMLHKMLSRNPKDRPTAYEVWLRFPKCTCCSNWQAPNHSPTPYWFDELMTTSIRPRDKSEAFAGRSGRDSIFSYRVGGHL